MELVDKATNDYTTATQLVEQYERNERTKLLVSLHRLLRPSTQPIAAAGKEEDAGRDHEARKVKVNDGNAAQWKKEKDPNQKDEEITPVQ